MNKDFKIAFQCDEPEKNQPLAKLINFSLGKAVISGQLAISHQTLQSTKVLMNQLYSFEMALQGEELILSYMTTAGCHYLSSSKNRNKNLFLQVELLCELHLATLASHRNSTF